tara:strand:+ start:638 stop:1459 length:822 start_codon:yes stop_codon:yes gene_type:complete
MKKITLILLSIFFLNCSSKQKESKTNEVETIENDAIRVLNFGSSHLSNTSDANKSLLDISNPKVKLDLDELVKKLVTFKPTVICIELQPDNNNFVNETYEKYKIDQSNRLNYSDEMNAIGFEVGRLSGVKKIYGIDSQIGFDYPSLIKLANNSKTDSLFVENVMNSYKIVNNLPLLQQFKEINTKSYKMETFNFYNFLASMHTQNNYEGADIIAEFYKRNLRIYSNLEDIPLSKEDRVLIILGATHTAYLDVFLENNPKYKLENALDYFKIEE